MKKLSIILMALVLCISVFCVPAMAEETITVYVSIDSDTAPNAWAWGSYGDAFSSWPGEPMTKEGDLWKIEVPMGTTGFIANNGSAQTTDITLDGASDAWITISADFSTFEVSYEAPAVDVPTDAPVETPDEPVETPDEPTETPDEPVVDEPVVDEPAEDTDAPADGETAAPETDEPAEDTNTTGENKEKAPDVEKPVKFLGMTMARKTRAILVISLCVLVAIVLAAILSIPKKIK
ncbi:MAG: starch-binding protein [Ruminococcaceae bacterium]|nr:starch-binding protein [Oscillospiraceae bacterium]